MKPFQPRFSATPTLPLGASEKEIRALLAASEPVVFPAGDEEDGRTIQAEWIADLATSRGHFEKPVRVANARIDGPLVVTGATFELPVVFVRCRFDSPISAARATFRRALILRRSQFEGKVDLTRSETALDVELSHSDFRSSLQMLDARMQMLRANGATFRSANFTRLHVDRGMAFIPARSADGTLTPTRFLGMADFLDARVRFTAEFNGALFEENARFERMELGATMFMRLLTRVGGKDVPKEQQTSVIFKGNVSFLDFACHSLIFQDVVVHGDAFFDRVRAQEAWFTRSRFRRKISFAGAAIAGDFRFTRVRSVFPVGMTRLSVGAGLWLTSTDAPALDLRRARIGVLVPYYHAAKPEDAPFNGTMNLRGATFERLDDDWRHFVKLIEPFSRDPYDSLERHLRSSGEEREAGDVYFERRLREGRAQRERFFTRLRKRQFGEAWRDLRRVSVDFIEHHLASYGVRSMRLFVTTLLLLVLGALVFMRDDALRQKPSGNARATNEEAIVYSAALAIPLVQLPPLERWRPSERPIAVGNYQLMRYETFAVIYRLLCFVFVPLTVAAFSGLLNRRDR